MQLRVLKRARVARLSRRLAAWLVVLACLAELAQAGDSTVGERLAALSKLPPLEACDKIERLLDEDPTEDDRRAVLRRLRELSPRAVPARSEHEGAVVDGLRTSAAPRSAETLGRHVIVLAPPEALTAASAVDALATLDLAYTCLRDLFAFDPNAAAGRRCVLYATSDVKGEPQGDVDRLTIAFASDPPLRAQDVEALVRELGRMFAARHPAQQLFSAGFANGWADVARVYVADRIAFQGDPLRARFNAYRAAFEEAARAEYVATRLPIEAIGSSAASACLLRLALVGNDARALPDWAPFRRLFREVVRGGEPPLHLHPALQASALSKAFGAARTRAVLAEFRFPPDVFAEREAETWSKRATAARKSSDAERWKQDGEIVLREWRVIGPLARAAHAAGPGDPLDVENWSAVDLRALPSIDGAAWSEDVRTDERGLLDLSALPRGKEPGIFYLVARWPDALTKTSALFVASTGEVTGWLNGVRVARHAGGAEANPAAAARVFTRGAPKGSSIVMQLVSAGGPTALHVRASAQTPLEYAYRVELRSPDVERRLAIVRYLGSRRVDAELVLDALKGAVSDAAREVRVAAARGLAAARNRPDAVAALVDQWGLEKESFVAATLFAALEELTFERFESSAAAARWWREDGGKRWRQARFIECESALADRRVSGGGLGSNPSAFGGLCVDRCFGADPSDRMEVVLEAPTAGPREVRLRYACPRGGARIALRVWRGDEIVFTREGLEVVGTADWQTWSWLSVPVGDLRAGKHRVELLLANGCIACDVIGLTPRTQ
ncbi:MAG: hypothetical protein ACKVWV_03110 [Planctomycetota bacterium]